MTPALEELTDAAIKSFLETAPLYSWREFKRPRINRSSLWINEIDSHCDQCEQNRPFHDPRPRGGGAGMTVPALKSGTSYFYFSCVSCRNSHRQYHVEQILEDETIKLQKFGELPRGKIPRDRALQKFLKDDLENYEKAVICLSHEYGVAAFAYFRRIVESNIHALLDMLRDDTQASGGDKSVLQAIEDLRNDSPMSEKIKVANIALPSHLKPDGLNPLGRLYQGLSEGVHTLSEAECLQRAKAIAECLTFLVGELAARREHRARFKAIVGSL